MSRKRYIFNTPARPTPMSMALTWRVMKCGTFPDEQPSSRTEERVELSTAPHEVQQVSKAETRPSWRSTADLPIGPENPHGPVVGPSRCANK